MTIEHFKDTLLKKLPKFNVLVVLMLNLLFVKEREGILFFANPSGRFGTIFFVAVRPVQPCQNF